MSFKARLGMSSERTRQPLIESNPCSPPVQVIYSESLKDSGLNVRLQALACQFQRPTNANLTGNTITAVIDAEARLWLW